MIENQYRELFKTLGIEERGLYHVLRYGGVARRVYFDRNREVGIYFSAHSDDEAWYPSNLWDKIDPDLIPRKADQDRLNVVPKPGMEVDAFRNLVLRWQGEEHGGNMPELIECRACGRDISSSAKYCRHCGEPNPDHSEPPQDHPRLKQCRACGRDIPSSDKYCRYCGEPDPGYQEPLPSNPRLKQCRACGRDMSKSAKQCPHCGDPNPDYSKPPSFWGCVGGLILVTVSILILYFLW